MQELPEALRPMAAYAQFILWRPVPSKTRPGKVDKFPVNPHTGAISDAHDPTIWLDADSAIAAGQAQGLGIGFVFTKSDPFFFFDIDNCLDRAGQWSARAQQFCQVFAGAAIEISQSGTGLHIFGSGPVPSHGCQNREHGLEFYTELRFAALTGTGAVGSAAFVPSPEAIAWLVGNFFPQGVEHDDDGEWTDGPDPEWNGPTDDQELINKMLGSRSAASVLGGKASVADLWTANEEALEKSYPDTGGAGRSFDRSSADAALCSHLAFWTGKDCERIGRLFKLSALCRDKWIDREDYYARRTILRAVGLCSDVYASKRKDKAPELPADPVEPGATPAGEIRPGFQYLAVTQQIDLFKGCTYVRDIHRVFVPDGALLKPEQFNAMYGGYVFALDSFNDKITKKAWEVFTESQAYNFPKAHSVCFRPELEPGAIVEEEGRRLVNTYSPIDTPRLAGDPSPFLGHLAKMLPSPDDQAIILAYMAACVQHKGSKFQWAPLLQGTEGNGKSLIGSILAEAIGHRYTHKVNPQDIGNVFNAWVSGNLLAIVEEVYTADRREIIETLKWLITESRVPITSKGVDQATGDNRANFVMFTNHKDAIRKTINDRRNAIFFTAQQTKADKIRDGMGGAYFPVLYNWLRGGGYAIMADFLYRYAIPAELNPALDRGGLCIEAPHTTSTNEAIAVGLGGIEQEVMEAIDEGRPGFAGGWVSSMAFDRMLQESRRDRQIPPNKRREILRSLGYDLHPALKGGRVNSIVPLDNGKPRLYIREGHIGLNITKAAEVAKAYLTAQGFVVGGAGAGATATATA